MSTYVLAPTGNGKGIGPFDFNLSEGDVVVVKTDLADDGDMFLRALATLVRPERGRYSFMGRTLDFSDYRNLLSVKRRIAYIPNYSSLISNRTLLENLQLMEAYFGDGMSQPLPENIMEMCRYFRMEDKLHFRPAQADPESLRLAVIIRELSKDPEVILVDGPRHFLGFGMFDLFMDLLQNRSADGTPLVFLSSEEDLVKQPWNKEVRIAKCILTVNDKRDL